MNNRKIKKKSLQINYKSRPCFLKQSIGLILPGALLIPSVALAHGGLAEAILLTVLVGHIVTTTVVALAGWLILYKVFRLKARRQFFILWIMVFLGSLVPVIATLPIDLQSFMPFGNFNTIVIYFVVVIPAITFISIKRILKKNSARVTKSEEQ